MPNQPDMQEFAIVPLPPALCQALDALAEGDWEPAHQQYWQSEKQSLDQLLTESEALSLGPEQDGYVKQARAELQALDDALAAGQAEEASEAAFRLYRQLYLYERYRERSRHTQVEELNDVLLMGQALLCGKGSAEILHSLLPAFVGRTDHLLEAFKRGEEDLPAEVRQALLRGFDSLARALAQLRTWDGHDEAALRKAMTDLKNGAELVVHIHDWEQQMLAPVEVLPGAGLEFLALQEELEAFGAAQEETLKLFMEQGLPQLQQAWTEMRQQLWVTPPMREQLGGRIEATFELLHRLPEVSAQEQQALLDTLVELYAELASLKPEREQYADHPSPWLGDLVLAALADGVPRFRLRQTASEAAAGPVQGWGAAVLRFLDEEDRGYLAEALDELKRQVEEQQAGQALQQFRNSSAYGW